MNSQRSTDVKLTARLSGISDTVSSVNIVPPPIKPYSDSVLVSNLEIWANLTDLFRAAGLFRWNTWVWFPRATVAVMCATAPGGKLRVRNKHLSQVSFGRTPWWTGQAEGSRGPLHARYPWKHMTRRSLSVTNHEIHVKLELSWL